MADLGQFPEHLVEGSFEATTVEVRVPWAFAEEVLVQAFIHDENYVKNAADLIWTARQHESSYHNTNELVLEAKQYSTTEEGEQEGTEE